MILTHLLFAYLLVAFSMFATLVWFGKILKKDILGNGVKCGMLNSLLLSSLWPLCAIACIVGMCYELACVWKKI